MNMLQIIVSVLFVTSVLCDDCVRYTFEDSFEDLFDNMEAPCFGMPFWKEQEYSSINMESPHENSARFVSPLQALSCVSSFPFTMSVGGTVEINVYMDSMSTMDTINILASQMVVGGNDANVGSYIYNPSTLDYVPGWQTLRFTVSTSSVGTFEGYIAFMGIQGPGSTVLVDSFRYVAPNLDENSCNLYEEKNEITTLAPTTEPDTEPDTEPPCDTSAPTTGPEINTPTEAPTIVTEAETTSDLTTTTTHAPECEISPHPEPEPEPEPDQEVDIEFLENRCPVNPRVHWLLPHEDNCNLFYYCVWGEKVLRECPSELHFNSVIQVCDWPQSAGCAVSINKHAEARRRLLL